MFTMAAYIKKYKHMWFSNHKAFFFLSLFHLSTPSLHISNKVKEFYSKAKQFRGRITGRSKTVEEHGLIFYGLKNIFKEIKSFHLLFSISLISYLYEMMLLFSH